METEPQAASGSRILALEDEPDIAALVAYQLTRDGFRVETASTGPDALVAARRTIPDVLILHLMLHGMAGDRVLEALRGEEATAALPVLLVGPDGEGPES